MRLGRAKHKKQEPRRGRSGVIPLLAPGEIEQMRAAGRLAGRLLDEVAKRIQPGINTLSLDNFIDEFTRAHGAVSATLGYGHPPYSRCSCISVNDVVCHGIPDAKTILRDGDIVNVDVTPKLNGFHGDSSRTFLVGDVAPKARRLVADTHHALWLGIRAVRPGATTGDIGHAIQQFAEAQGYGVVREFTGHGTGRIFHTAPTIFHHGKPGEGDRLVPGMTFTIEPMINLGHWKTEILEDRWTAVTADGSLSAQFEHTVLVTPSGVEPLTLGENEKPPI
ncbi:MAG TPA: type I methionyl aminopeptidase [Myxococcota bacterium]|jgi:methionyl aminopeptidase